jgi:cullin 1
VSNYLNAETETKLLRVLEEEVLERREAELLEKEGSGCRALLAQDRVEDLSRMYRLFARLTEGLVPMAEMFRLHVEALGAGFIEQRTARIDGGGGGEDKSGEEKKDKGGEKEDNEDPQFVRDLLGLHDKYVTMVADQFCGNALFQKALKEAFVEIVNRNVGKYPNSELLSSFCDRILKVGGEKICEQDAEDLLEKVVQLFSYLTGASGISIKISSKVSVHRQGYVRRVVPQSVG